MVSSDACVQAVLYRDRPAGGSMDPLLRGCEGPCTASPGWGTAAGHRSSSGLDVLIHTVYVLLHVSSQSSRSVDEQKGITKNTFTRFVKMMAL